MLSILGDIMCGQIRKPFSAIFVEALYERRITPRSSYSNTRTNGSSQAGASGTDRLVGVLRGLKYWKSITGGNKSIGRVLWGGNKGSKQCRSTCHRNSQTGWQWHVEKSLSNANWQVYTPPHTFVCCPALNTDQMRQKQILDFIYSC